MKWQLQQKTGFALQKPGREDGGKQLQGKKPQTSQKLLSEILSIMATFKYTALQQLLPSDDEDGLGEDEDDVVFDRKNGARKLKKPMIDLNLAGWSHGEDPSVKFQGHPKKTCLLVTLLMLILGGAAIAITLSIVNKRGQIVDGPKSAPDWTVRLNDTASESCVQLVDVDGDGLDDMLVGTANSAASEIAMKKIAKEGKTVRQACAEMGEPYPCMGNLVAFRGYDGKELWRTKVRSNIIFINCREVDVNQDGQFDCIVSGRISTLQAIDPKTGKTLWVTESEAKPWNTVFVPSWNIYQAVALPDFTGDGIPEVLIANGGNPSISPEDHDRESGRLIVISGATGKPIGPGFLAMPDSKETYMTPVLYTAKDSSVYVLFGSGGETVPGNFYAVSLPDLYVIVKQDRGSVHVVPGIDVRDRYGKWEDKKNRTSKLITIYTGVRKGVMVPPVLADLTGDGEDDILVSAYDGFLILFDGKDLREIWRQKFPEMESYSTPAPGYFDGDDVIDFMMHWSHGAWPRYDAVVHVVVSGKDGSILWQSPSSRNEMASDLVLRTTVPHQDAYVFAMRGRLGSNQPGKESLDSHGLLGNPSSSSSPPRNRPRRHGEGMEETPSEETMDDNFFKLTPQEAKSECEAIYADFSRFHSECTDNLDIETEEVFLMDRKLAVAPLRLLETKAEMFHYELDHIEGNNHCHPVDPVTKKIKMCAVIVPDVQTTAAIGDVDGDGRPDLLKVGAEVGSLITDRYSSYKTVNNLVIRKVSIADAVSRQATVPLNVSTSLAFQQAPDRGMHNFTFLPMEKQRWTSYLSHVPFSTYREP